MSRGRNSETVAHSVLVLERDRDQKWEDDFLVDLGDSDECLGPVLAEPLEPLEDLEWLGELPRSRVSIGAVTEWTTSLRLLFLKRDGD